MAAIRRPFLGFLVLALGLCSFGDVFTSLSRQGSRGSAITRRAEPGTKKVEFVRDESGGLVEPKRPPSAWILFLSDNRWEIQKKVSSSKEVLKIASARWKELDATNKQPYAERAAEAKTKYAADIAEFVKAGGKKKPRKAKKADEIISVTKKEQGPNAFEITASAYGAWLADKREEIEKSLPAGHTDIEVTNKARGLWRNLTQAEKQPYQEKFPNAFKTTASAYGAWRADKREEIEKSLPAGHTDIEATNKARKLWRNLAEAEKKPYQEKFPPMMPVRGAYPGAYRAYVADKREEIEKSLPAGHSYIEVTKKARKLWSSLAEDEKKPYQARYETEMEKYLVAKAKYEAKVGNKDPSATPKPLSSYMLWLKENQAYIVASLPRDISLILPARRDRSFLAAKRIVAKEAGARWKKLSSDQQQPFINAAVQLREEYKKIAVRA